MNSKIVTTLALFAILFGSAFGSNIQMLVFHNSNNWWLAVDPMSEAGATSKMEVMEAGGAWTAMSSDNGWGYFTYQTNKGSGFSFPLSFRMTDASGNQVVANNVMSSITAGKTVDSGVAFALPPVTAPAAACGPTAPATQAPTTPATHAPTAPSASGHSSNGHSSGHHGSGSSTSAPTTKPSTTATAAPATQAPTRTPSTSGSATQAPTSKPTAAPSTGHSSGSATSAPTTKPTAAPTTKPSTSGSSSSGSSSGSSTDLCTVTPTSQEPLQILIPLYVEPGSAWDEVISAAATGVKIIAIINPNSGPSTSGPDSSYKTYMQKFATAGIEMVGYVHTSYGARSISDVTSDISTYASLYSGLAGIFIDECSASASEISYYQQVYSAITSHSGYSNAILNPGTQPDQGYLAVSTNIVVFESPASSFKTNFASWVTCAPSASEKSGYKYRFSAIAYGASSSSMSSTLASMNTAGMGMVYVTDGAAGCCTYNTLASYFTSEASAVAALN